MLGVTGITAVAKPIPAASDASSSAMGLQVFFGGAVPATKFDKGNAISIKQRSMLLAYVQHAGSGAISTPKR